MEIHELLSLLENAKEVSEANSKTLLITAPEVTDADSKNSVIEAAFAMSSATLHLHRAIEKLKDWNSRRSIPL